MCKIHAFNTQRLYSTKGQRIAWTILSTGNIAVVDIDRHIDYILKQPESSIRVDNWTVLDLYDHADSSVLPWNMAEHAEFREIQNELIAAAEKL